MALGPVSDVMRSTLRQINAGVVARINGDRTRGTLRSRILGDMRSYGVPSLLRRGYIEAQITDPSPLAWYICHITDEGREFLLKDRSDKRAIGAGNGKTD